MNLLKSLATVSFWTLASRILGFVRDFVIAREFGAAAVTDAFFVAFRLPNLLRRMFAEGAFSQAFVPLLSEYRNRLGPEATRALVDRVSGLLALALTLVTVVGILAAPLIINVSAPGFSSEPDKFALTVLLTRITFPYILLISLVALAAGILNTWSRFSVPAAGPVLLNLSFIGMALFAAPYFDPPVLALAWAVVLGGILQLALQLPALARIGMLPRPRLDMHHAGVRRVLKLMAPALLGVSVSQISLVLNTIFASFLPHGSVSWLYYADRLMEFPAGLLGAALGTILLPSLSRLHADARAEEFSDLLDWGLRLTLMLTLPAALALALLATPLIATLFQHGAFGAQDVGETGRALVAYSLGLVGLIAVKVLAPGYYARQDIRTPVRIALVTLAVTQLLNCAFVIPFAHAGLALSIGLASCVNAGLLLRGLLRRGTYRPRAGWTGFMARLLLALGALAITLYFMSGDTGAWTALTQRARMERLALVVVSGIAVYFASLALLGFRLRDFQRRGA
ncbi:MAG: putative lipid II flippase MurJ [Betaproteobacteria bacterium]